MASLLDFLGGLNQRREDQIFSPMQRFGMGLDALILPEARMGESIREQAIAQYQENKEKDQRNRTVQYLKGLPGGEVYAAAVESGVPVNQVYSAYLKAQEGDYVVVGNQLVDRKTGKVIFSAPKTTGGTITRFNPDTGQMEIIQSNNLSGLDLTSSNETQSQKVVMASQGLMKGFAEYERLFKEGGAAVLPGTQKDSLLLARRNLQMQMKELFNLGVLNGPDLDLMDQMIVDATNPLNYALDVFGVADLEQRVQTNIKNLKIQLEQLATPSILALGLNPRDIFGDTSSTQNNTNNSSSGPKTVKKF
tara:strand:- start:579 stop:1496 length:918 start_codon:yes stop_codon:yes gene_type:complete